MSLDWTDTAKRLAAHPKWEWLEGMLAKPDLDAQKFTPFIVLPQRIGRDGLLSSAPHFPDLTDWQTFGLVFGMVIEAGYFVEGQTDELVVQRLDGKWGVNSLGWDGSGLYLERDLADKETPGQALGELWLELVEVA